MKQINVKKEIRNNLNNYIDIHDANNNDICILISKFFVLYKLNYTINPLMIKYPEVTDHIQDLNGDCNPTIRKISWKNFFNIWFIGLFLC